MLRDGRDSQVYKLVQGRGVGAMGEGSAKSDGHRE